MPKRPVRHRSRAQAILVPGAWTCKFDPFKLGFIVALAAYGYFCALHYTVSGFINGTNPLMMFVHGINLIFHEAGHSLFMIFGHFLHILGGSLLQILVPAVISGYFFYTQQPYAAAVALCWTGENFWDVSIYIKDAQLRLLPLLGGEGVLHDWHFLLLDLRLLPQGQLIGNMAHTIGVIIYAIAILTGIYCAQIKENQNRKLRN